MGVPLASLLGLQGFPVFAMPFKSLCTPVDWDFPSPSAGGPPSARVWTCVVTEANVPFCPTRLLQAPPTTVRCKYLLTGGTPVQQTPMKQFTSQLRSHAVVCTHDLFGTGGVRSPEDARPALVQNHALQPFHAPTRPISFWGPS